MQHTAIRGKNEVVEFFCYSDEVAPEIKVFKLGLVLNFEQIIGTYPITDLGDNIRKSVLTTPDENCYLCIKFGSYPIFIRVGHPNELFLFYGSDEGRTIQYRQKLLSDGIVSSSGTLNELGNGFYFHELTTLDYSVIEVFHENDPQAWETFLVGVPYPGDTSISGKGSIQIEPNRWQLLAIPVKYGYYESANGRLIHDNTTRATIYNYVIKQLEYKYSLAGNQMIQVANAYIGDDNAFRNFVVGITHPMSIHNFNLVYEDTTGTGDTYNEVVGFWVKSISLTPLILNWGE